jgi:NADH-quinone oxidoreductase subunit N
MILAQEQMTIDWLALSPEIALALTALVVLAADFYLVGDRKRFVNPLAGVGTAIAIVFTFAIYGQNRETFDGMFVASDFALLFKLLFLFTLLAILAISYHYFAEGRYFQGEYYFLLVSAFVGMILLPSSRDLLLLFVAVETVSIPAFVMAGLRKRDLYSSEAALKFFLIGVLAVAAMLFGMSLVYGATGTTDLVGIAEALRANTNQPAILHAGMLLTIAGFGFKVSAVPFHFWAPDTYSGSPLPVTAMLAVASKAAGFAGLAMICFIAFEPLAHVWAPVLGVLAVVTMTIGNLLALQQRDLIRLLAYSSIAHAGYILVPFGVIQAGATEINQTALQAVLFYLIAYAVMNVGAFGIALGVQRHTGKRSISDLGGLGYRSPALAIMMTIFMLALGGAPLTVGLWAKIVVFWAAAGAAAYVLAAAVVINTVIGFFYYLAVLRTMWFAPAEPGAAYFRPGILLTGTTGVLAAATIALGVFPAYWNLPVGDDIVGTPDVAAASADGDQSDAATEAVEAPDR